MPQTIVHIPNATFRIGLVKSLGLLHLSIGRGGHLRQTYVLVKNKQKNSLIDSNSFSGLWRSLHHGRSPWYGQGVVVCSVRGQGGSSLSRRAWSDRSPGLRLPSLLPQGPFSRRHQIRQDETAWRRPDQEADWVCQRVRVLLLAAVPGFQLETNRWNLLLHFEDF